MKRPGLIRLAIGLTILLSLVAARNWAQNNDVNVQFHSFQDTRGATVLSPTAELAKDFTERTNLRVSFGVDAISAASDSCARCHRDGVNSQRLVGGLSVTEKFDAFKVTVGGAYSQENFYRATTLLTSVSRDLANGNTTVAGGYTFSLNQPKLHPTEQVETQYQNGAFVSLTQTLSRLTIAQVGYEVGAIYGYQNNPFLRANVNGSLVLGQVPDSRIRQTLTARLRQALPGRHVSRSRLPPLLRRLAGRLERAQRWGCRITSRRRCSAASTIAVTIRQGPPSISRTTSVRSRSISPRTSGSSRSPRGPTPGRSSSRRKGSSCGFRRTRR